MCQSACTSTYYTVNNVDEDSLLPLAFRLLSLDKFVVADIVRIFLAVVIVGRWFRSFIRELYK